MTATIPWDDRDLPVFASRSIPVRVVYGSRRHRDAILSLWRSDLVLVVSRSCHGNDAILRTS